MDRRNFLKLIGATAAGAAFSSRIGRAAKSRRPNVILMMADDFGYECLSCNGGSPYKTPCARQTGCRGNPVHQLLRPAFMHALASEDHDRQV